MDTNIKRILTIWIAASAVLIAVIVLTFVLYAAQINAFAEGVIATPQPGYATALIIIALLATDIVLPVPSSLLSTACGALFNIVPGAVVSWIGMTLGCMIAYGIGIKLGLPVIQKLADIDSIAKSQNLFKKYGYWGLVLARPIPVLAETTAIMGGISGMTVTSFASAVALSNLGISVVYASAGALLPAVAVFWVIVGGISLPLLVWLMRRLLSRFSLLGIKS